MARAVISFFKKNHQKPFFYSSLFFALLFLIAIFIRLVFGWNPPTDIAPNPAGQTLYSDSSNNIGIGTSTPSAKLEVYSSSSDSILKLSRQSATSTLFKLGTDSALIINNNNSDVLTIKNGNVGIGTTNPGDKLHVAGGGIILDNNKFLRGKGTDGNAYAITGYGTDDYAYIFGSHAGGVKFYDAWNAQTRMTVLTSGNVGIGTTPASGAKLEVAGTIHSTTGGFKFPDNTTQTTAATSASSNYLTATCRDVSCATKCAQAGRSCSSALYTYVDGTNPPFNVSCDQTYSYDCASFFTCLCY